MKRPEDKVIVLGIDGVPCSLLHRFMEVGIMPNLSKLSRSGTLSSMTASIPEVSSTSWTTFMTGVNPGKHGIYGFTELQDGSYKWNFPNSNDIKSETLWEIAGKNNKKSIVLNVPSTYPAKALNGILTAGFVALDLKKATHPDSAYAYLQSIGYKMDVDTRKAQESAAALAEEINSAFHVRKKAILHFMDTGDWNLFIGVITETDRLHHYLWTALDDDTHPQHGFFLEFYKNLDTFIGEMYDRTDDSIPFIILSDHGFTTIRKEVYLNSWLRERDYLKFNKESPESMVDMCVESKAFVLDPARIYIHKKGRYPHGSVDESEYKDLREKIKKELLSFEIEAEKVIQDVFFKEEIYSGSLLARAPDLVALPRKGFDLKASINKPQLFGKGLLTGGHTRDNAVFYINRETPFRDINIVDVGPTIISLLGIKGNTFDGKCLIE